MYLHVLKYVCIYVCMYQNLKTKMPEDLELRETEHMGERGT